MMAQSDPELATAILLLLAPSFFVLLVLWCVGAAVEWFHDRRENFTKSPPFHGRTMPRKGVQSHD